MYPSGDLKQLALRRECLQLQIELRRQRCVAIGCHVGEKFEKWMKWGRILRGGFLGVASFGLLRRRRNSDSADFDGESPSSLGGHLLRWTPVAWRAVRLVTGW
jgi:hypothetical protein